MQARGQITLLAIVAAVMSVVCLMRAHHFSQWEMHLPLVLTRK